MGAIYTSKRRVGKNPIFYQRRNATGSNQAWVDQVNPARPFLIYDSQETTSYRSRGREGDIEESPFTEEPGKVTHSDATEAWMKENFPTRPPRTEGLKTRVTLDMGHPFTTTRILRNFGPENVRPVEWFVDATPDRVVQHNAPRPSITYTHQGIKRNVLGDPDPSWFINTNDTVSGNEAIAATAPTRPAFSLANAVGELLTSGIPALATIHALKDAASIFRAAGSNYLNVQFGWVPLVRDIQNLVMTLQNASDVLENYQKGSGQQTRRRWHLKTLQYNQIFSGSDVDGGGVSGNSTNGDGSSTSNTVGGDYAALLATDPVVYVSATQERWFSGAYTYYLPPEGSFDRFRSLADKLLGVELTPEVLWNLAPWSWLTDWGLAVGSNIAAAQRFQDDNLVLRYGYLMVRDRVTVTSTFNYSGTSVGGAPFKRKGYTRVYYDRKRRVKSTPFGFGMNPTTDFNPFQWSILAALGMTKAPRTLR